MKLQHMIIIFLVIMLPMALIMSQYTGLQIDTLSTKIKYDTYLLGATFDTMSAFELNTLNSASSSVIGEEIRDLEAVISTFATSLSTTLKVSGEHILSYVPAIVFGLYDGYYIYAKNDTGTGNELKPYVYYSKTYSYGNTNITISYSLDNYVSIYGTYGEKSVSAAGYLVIPDDVEVSQDFAYVLTTEANGRTTKRVLDPGGKSTVKYKGYNISEEIIYENETVIEKQGIGTNKARQTTEGMMYYYEALEFTKLYNNIVNRLSIADKNTLYISKDNDPEDENSAFMNEKIEVMQSSITENLNNAIYNYEGGVSVNYEMPQLKGEDWDNILNNISITAFLKDVPIGTTTYNNYVVVTSTTNQKYCSAKSINFIEYQADKSCGYFHKITCEDLIKSVQDKKTKLVGYASVDFQRYRYSPENTTEYFYYYKHNEYADYECEVESIESTNVANIEKYVNNKTQDRIAREEILKSYYTAVGRIRFRLIKASSYINLDTQKSFSVEYFPNGGTWSRGNSLTENTNIGRLSTTSETPTKVGKKFMGWSTSSNATSAEVKVGDTIYVQNGRKIQLYAVYM